MLHNLQWAKVDFFCSALQDYLRSICQNMIPRQVDLWMEINIIYIYIYMKSKSLQNNQLFSILKPIMPHTLMYLNQPTSLTLVVCLDSEKIKESGCEKEKENNFLNVKWKFMQHQSHFLTFSYKPNKQKYEKYIVLIILSGFLSFFYNPNIRN